MKKASNMDPLDRTFTLDSLKGKGVRGKYLPRIEKGDESGATFPGSARLFPTDAAVNNALLSLAELSRKLPELGIQPKRSPRKRVTV